MSQRILIKINFYLTGLCMGITICRHVRKLYVATCEKDLQRTITRSIVDMVMICQIW